MGESVLPWQPVRCRIALAGVSWDPSETIDHVSFHVCGCPLHVSSFQMTQNGTYEVELDGWHALSPSLLPLTCTLGGEILVSPKNRLPDPDTALLGKTLAEVTFRIEVGAPVLRIVGNRFDTFVMPGEVLALEVSGLPGNEDGLWLEWISNHGESVQTPIVHGETGVFRCSEIPAEAIPQISGHEAKLLVQVQGHLHPLAQRVPLSNPLYYFDPASELELSMDGLEPSSSSPVQVVDVLWLRIQKNAENPAQLPSFLSALRVRFGPLQSPRDLQTVYPVASDGTLRISLSEWFQSHAAAPLGTYELAVMLPSETQSPPFVLRHIQVQPPRIFNLRFAKNPIRGDDVTLAWDIDPPGASVLPLPQCRVSVLVHGRHSDGSQVLLLRHNIEAYHVVRERSLRLGDVPTPVIDLVVTFEAVNGSGAVAMTPIQVHGTILEAARVMDPDLTPAPAPETPGWILGAGIAAAFVVTLVAVLVAVQTLRQRQNSDEVSHTEPDFQMNPLYEPPIKKHTFQH